MAEKPGIKLKKLTAQGVETALGKADLLRLHHEPDGSPSRPP
ncbi:MAG: hypothetical protein ACYCW6_29305 [Candidatus Xenobia bacterium]